MNHYLQKIHSIFFALKVVGEPYTDADLVPQTLLGLPREIKPLLLRQYRGKPKSYLPRGGKTYRSYPSKFNASGILREKLATSAKKDVKCQICGKFNHEAFECRKSLVSYIGATAHMIDNASLLSNLTPYIGSSNVMVGSGALLSITHIGSSIIKTPIATLHLKNVLLVVSLTKNLISIQKLCEDNHCLTKFSSFLFHVKDLRTKRTMLTSTNHHSFYPLPAHQALATSTATSTYAVSFKL
ncbi:hypothetical protein LIER_13004 [Lithospermum erythrorhizon]|uniref:Retrovirus-related Pol polyprotein from transposon TNT 1-94-like beta-barrel domain-containing protein n=1 Tax=Lithospermum erythrorhizon TaxID=34254 RepID=A0AAV3PVZ5_LITER